jgi:dTDP-glucose 4,6-dehydratase
MTAQDMIDAMPLTGIRKTVQWYLDNQDWVERVQSGEYKMWLTKNYS